MQVVLLIEGGGERLKPQNAQVKLRENVVPKTTPILSRTRPLIIDLFACVLKTFVVFRIITRVNFTGRVDF